MKNSIQQVRVPLENIADVVSEFRDNVCDEFNMVNSEKHYCEVQCRGIGKNFEFGEDIRRSDDEITYYLKDDRFICCVIIRRTEFNNAEITMFTTEERFPNK